MIRGAGRAFTAACLVLALGAVAFAQTAPPGARAFTIARLKYGGGGDWYGTAPRS
jgi:hypothetical protein